MSIGHNMHRLTIITSTFNSINHLQNLINSVKKYKENWVQWIVVDGNSTDGTIDLLKKNIDIIDNLIIENDTGIYDAWNKALKHINGQYICFIGSDDDIAPSYFKNVKNSLETITNNVICFKIAIFENNKENIKYELHKTIYVKPNKYPFELGFHHQGTLFHVELFKKNSFDTSYKILGDLAHLTLQNQDLNPIIILTKAPQYYFNNAGVSSRKDKLILRYKERISIIKNIDGYYLYKIGLIFFYNLKIIYKSL